ncbi:hypothetical protein [Streptomyces sp. NPDC051183]|uniref:type II toxin-antitoxin system VapC family toxin n=1 Tax=Streptomyces sp. NPDC051183 TaxID=3155165 RepID=UPI00342D58FA
MNTGYILDHTAIAALAHGDVYMAARVFRSVRQVQPLYVPAVALAEGLTGVARGDVAQMLRDALCAPCFVFRALDEAGCWAAAQLARERAADLPTAHAAYIALGSGLPVLTRQADRYKQIDAGIVTEPIP